MPEITATVVAKSASGVMLKENGPWFNWSLVEYRGEPFNTEVQKGDTVQITYAEKEYTDKETGEPFTKYFVSTIDKVTGGATPARDVDNAFPPDEDFPPGDVLPGVEPPLGSPPDATSEPVEPVLDKDHLIVRQTCIKAAGMALQHNMGNAEEKAGQMTYLAGVLEDWCWR